MRLPQHGPRPRLLGIAAVEDRNGDRHRRAGRRSAIRFALAVNSHRKLVEGCGPGHGNSVLRRLDVLLRHADVEAACHGLPLHFLGCHLRPRRRLEFLRKLQIRQLQQAHVGDQAFAGL